MPLNDGEWHSVKWTRSYSNAQLYVDETLVGTSFMGNGTLSTAPPFYYGGTNPTDYGKVIEFIVNIQFYILKF